MVDERLIGDSIKAQEAAAGLVEGRRESDEEDILGDDFVHLDIGDKSPMVSRYALSVLCCTINNKAAAQRIKQLVQ